MRPGRGLSFLRWKAPCTSSVLTPLSGRAGGRASRTFCGRPHGAQACEQTPPWTLVCVFRKRALLVGFRGRSAPRETTERPGPVPRGPPASLLRGRQWVCDTLPPGPRFATQERNALLLYNGRFNEKHDFIALEIVDEQVQLTFSAGRAPSREGRLPGRRSAGENHPDPTRHPQAGSRLIPGSPSAGQTRDVQRRVSRVESTGGGSEGRARGLAAARRTRGPRALAGPGRGGSACRRRSAGRAGPRPLTSAFSRASAHR